MKVFFAGDKTTGVFHPTACPARKPKLENCEMDKTLRELNRLHSGQPPLPSALSS
ncbi:Ada metal-binding domain-containing protein [Paenibacillus lutrae]|uniref:Ada metal-binding domain-containing protein n=1 Tax=Paenibacillus lutrae TaxID=2078573 RepID=UPI00308466CB